MTTVSPHQSPLSDRCMCVCERVRRVPARTKDGDEGQDGWEEEEKVSFKVHLSTLLLLCSLCSESTGHDDDHRRLGLANVSITWGKTKETCPLLNIYKKLTFYMIKEPLIDIFE